MYIGHYIIFAICITEMARGAAEWMLDNSLSICAMVCSLAGNYLVNCKKRIGFIVWIVSNVLWILVNLLGSPNISQIVMFLVYMALNVQGWWMWRKK